MDRTIELMSDEEKLVFIEHLEKVNEMAVNLIRALDDKANVLELHRVASENVAIARAEFDKECTACNHYHNVLFEKYKGVEALKQDNGEE